MLRRVGGSEPAAVRRRLAFGKGAGESVLAGETVVYVAAVGSGMVVDIFRGVDRSSRRGRVVVLRWDSLSSFLKAISNKDETLRKI